MIIDYVFDKPVLGIKSIEFNKYNTEFSIELKYTNDSIYYYKSTTINDLKTRVTNHILEKFQYTHNIEYTKKVDQYLTFKTALNNLLIEGSTQTPHRHRYTPGRGEVTVTDNKVLNPKVHSKFYLAEDEDEKDSGPVLNKKCALCGSPAYKDKRGVVLCLEHREEQSDILKKV